MSTSDRLILDVFGTHAIVKANNFRPQFNPESQATGGVSCFPILPKGNIPGTLMITKMVSAFKTNEILNLRWFI